jgi:hypothetical protein
MTMIRYNKYILPALLVFICFSACKKAYFYSGINDDPSQLKNPTPSAILPGTILKSAYTWGGDASRYPSLFMQQSTGIANQAYNYSLYTVTPDDVDNMWYAGFYGAVMNDLHVMIDTATTMQQLHYAAVGRILMANDLGQVTDFWGDVPYTEAFQGLANKQPHYNSQQQLYDTLQSLLDQAIASLEVDDGSPFQPGSQDDLLFSGDLGLWTRFAHSLKAKFYLHIVKSDNSAIQKALAEIPQGLQDGEGAFVKFVGTNATTTQAPWYQFNTQRGDIAFDGYLNDLLYNAGDPRYSVYYDPSDSTLLGTLYGSANSPAYFISYDELKFIEAELQFRNNNKTAAAAAYNEAVRANLVRTVGDAAYLPTVAKTAVDITLNDIITQKYIGLFLSPEVWTDWRRTGYPALKAPAGNALNGQLPRSLLYPSSEQRYNVNAPKNTTMLRRVWWDVN